MSGIGNVRRMGNRVNPNDFATSQMVSMSHNFDQSQAFDASYITDARNRMRSSR